MVRLPNAANARVSESKIRDYLLSLDHPFGRHKARYFQGLGFTRAGWRVLYDTLLVHAAENTYLRTVWFVKDGEVTPNFVTAYPAKGGRR